MLHLEHIRSLNFVFPQNLPVIHSSVITRCRSCRTYINPFVTFTDSRRWRCPMCFRVNEGMSLQDLSYPLNILNWAVHTASSSVWSYIIMISNKWPEKKKKQNKTCCHVYSEFPILADKSKYLFVFALYIQEQIPG